MDLKGFIENEESLKESPRCEDLMNWEQEKEEFKIKLKNINKTSIIALVGPFGSGKSTFIDKIQRDLNKNNCWFNFEAWKYPERKNLWENFILDFVESSSIMTKKDIKSVLNGDLRGFKKYLKEFIIMLTSLAQVPSVGELFTINLSEDPMSRVNDYQNLLEKLLLKINKDTYITIEDIDRSGDKGIFFLETLKNFLDKNHFDRKITIIVPISTINYSGKDQEAYFKVIDYFEFFTPCNTDFLPFTENLIREELFEKPQDHLLLAEFLTKYFQSYPSMTLRTLKLILRDANTEYKIQTQKERFPDWRITLVSTMMKYTKVRQEEERNYYEESKKHSIIKTGNIFSAYIEAIRTNQQTITNRDGDFIYPSSDIKLIAKYPNEKDETWKSSPWLGRDLTFSQHTIYLENFYFNS
jgi:DNA polymerase III delta prime subunit